uniref:FkbM family methyltransferase n=1 Tax=Desertifilum tharense IPPAS B-1220 TaxID=1781255 RepID=A0ACD5GYD3_9CYAN
MKTISLDDFCQSQLNPVPQVIKMDIEGAEYQALKGAKQLFARAHPTLFLAIHVPTKLPALHPAFDSVELPNSSLKPA